ncbi:cytidine deaminase [Streptomyces sp. NPDC058045]|uniref:cytidine deaminase n=1 Tax=Streptomyces sp. NPDC058045 TaxID=3346311 RepID=UPI0036EE3B74
MSESSGIEVTEPEDRKAVSLARVVRSRNSAPEGATVRDETGRSHTASTVELDSFRLSALRAAVAMALAWGAHSLEAAAVVSEGPLADEDVAVVRELGGAGTPVLLATPDGTVKEIREA